MVLVCDVNGTARKVQSKPSDARGLRKGHTHLNERAAY